MWRLYGGPARSTQPLLSIINRVGGIRETAETQGTNLAFRLPTMPIRITLNPGQACGCVIEVPWDWAVCITVGIVTCVLMSVSISHGIVLLFQRIAQRCKARNRVRTFLTLQEVDSDADEDIYHRTPLMAEMGFRKTQEKCQPAQEKGVSCEEQSACKVIAPPKRAVRPASLKPLAPPPKG